MKKFGGKAIFLDRNDINTDEIIPAKYLTEITKNSLREHLLEDLLLDGKNFNAREEITEAQVVVTRQNFGCGSSREHAVWAFEVNNIAVIIAESFARIFRQNMFNCGILAIELDKKDIERLFNLSGDVELTVDLDNQLISARANGADQEVVQCDFEINPFDRDLVAVGGWLAYAAEKY